MYQAHRLGHPSSKHLQRYYPFFSTFRSVYVEVREQSLVCWCEGRKEDNVRLVNKRGAVEIVFHEPLVYVGHDVFA